MGKKAPIIGGGGGWAMQQQHRVHQHMAACTKEKIPMQVQHTRIANYELGRYLPTTPYTYTKYLTKN